MMCAYCGRVEPFDEEVCVGCGSEFSPDGLACDYCADEWGEHDDNFGSICKICLPEFDEFYCEECGVQIETEAFFCKECGDKLRADLVTLFAQHSAFERPASRAVKRPSPYLYVTWLTRLLSGENSCEYSTWFKTHHKNYETAKTFDNPEWVLNHRSLLLSYKNELESQGFQVLIEKQNHFTARGRLVTLAGQPDLVSVKDKYTVYEIKTGEPQGADQIQTMIYMWALPLAFTKYKGIRFDGAVVYADRVVRIPAARIDELFVSKIRALIHRVSASTPALCVPSFKECGFCRLTLADCAQKIEEIPEHELVEAW